MADTFHMVVENIQFECLQQTKLAGSTPVSATLFAPLFQRLEFRFCSPAMEVRVLHGAPSFEARRTA